MPNEPNASRPSSTPMNMSYLTVYLLNCFTDSPKDAASCVGASPCAQQITSEPFQCFRELRAAAVTPSTNLTAGRLLVSCRWKFARLVQWRPVFGTCYAAQHSGQASPVLAQRLAQRAWPAGCRAQAQAVRCSSQTSFCRSLLPVISTANKARPTWPRVRVRVREGRTSGAPHCVARWVPLADVA